ncbi:MAG: PTS fructose transporter subunit IIA [Rhodocyclales bacterium]|nr:PTS fructose transporter subunit IIA [Rhodocyclales bacterium]
MIGLLLITHGTLGDALLQCACHVLNERPERVLPLGLGARDDPLDLLPLARDMLDEVSGAHGAVILTDLFGATPANLALKLLQPGHVEGIAGVNLPMLIRALTYRNQDIHTLVQRSVSGGRDGVLHMR